MTNDTVVSKTAEEEGGIVTVLGHCLGLVSPHAGFSPNHSTYESGST